ncbi:MAG TPA: hypothetical protein HA328_04190 [Candidatus Poseidoniaceae archaeon]|nr:hypothetical protein [Candidatus Poseidoniaceae archaeon]
MISRRNAHLSRQPLKSSSKHTFTSNAMLYTPKNTVSNKGGLLIHTLGDTNAYD